MEITVSPQTIGTLTIGGQTMPAGTTISKTREGAEFRFPLGWAFLSSDTARRVPPRLITTMGVHCSCSGGSCSIVAVRVKGDVWAIGCESMGCSCERSVSVNLEEGGFVKIDEKLSILDIRAKRAQRAKMKQIALVNQSSEIRMAKLTDILQIPTLANAYERELRALGLNRDEIAKLDEKESGWLPLHYWGFDFAIRVPKSSFFRETKSGVEQILLNDLSCRCNTASGTCVKSEISRDAIRCRGTNCPDCEIF
jgi:hypothetical protein